MPHFVLYVTALHLASAKEVINAGFCDGFPAVLRVEVGAMFPSLLSQRLFLSQYSTPSSPIHFMPNTAKTNDHGGNEELAYGMASMQGWRDAMEDACTVRLHVADAPPFDEWSFFAVFDGHNGDCLAELAAQRLLDSIVKTPKFTKLAERLKRNHGQIDEKCLRRIRKGICNGFLTFDADAREKCNDLEPSGTAVLCAFVTPTLIVLANCGDSRGILSRHASPMLVTTDHTPMDAGEYERIRKAGGSIWHERINGSIALSRSLGDYCYKTDTKLSATEQLVSPEPDVHIVERNKSDDEFIILACDGIYDVFGDEELVSLVRSRLAVAGDLVAVANQVLDMALAQGSRDNMTLLLVAFEAAPKLSTLAVDREQKFCCELEAKIKAICSRVAHMDIPCVDDAHLKAHLAQEGVDEVPPGGLHIARLLVEQQLYSIPNSNRSVGGCSSSTYASVL
ncbi:phosphatase 2C containing protein [Aphelenchoides avenae]|nr:phosphatase 2C containing protein [Aphelenchus avenae]